jgi:hypothetical protein
MSRTYKDRERHIRVRGIRKDPPDLRRLARALIALAQAQAEAEAEAAHEQAGQPSTKPDAPGRPTPIHKRHATRRHDHQGDAA